MSLRNYIEQRRLEQEREVRRKIRNEKLSTAAKITLGTVVGAGIGILFAPKSGEETRDDIKNVTQDSVEYVTANVNTVAEAVKEKTIELKDAVIEKYEDFSNRNVTEIVPENLDDIEEKIDEVKENVENLADKVEENIEK